MDLSFSGAGFMGCYYFGVVSCWNKYIPRERVNRVAGASAGALIAAYYLMDLPLQDCLGEIIAMTEGIRKRPLGVFDRSNQIVDLLPALLERVFPDDAHKRVGDRLHVVMTRWKDMKKVVVSQFESKAELIEALNCSCFIPLWSGNRVSTYKGEKHIDGGFSDNLPVFDENTIRICCFAGPTDISPMGSARSELIKSNVLNTPVYVNLANAKRLGRALTPPPASYILDLLEQGFHDTKDFILSTDLIQCAQCAHERHFRLPRQSLTLTPSASRVHSRQGSFRLPQGGDDNGAAGLLSQQRSLPTQSSLSRQLHSKLRNYSPDSALSSEDLEHLDEDLNNNITLSVPAVVVEPGDDEDSSSNIDHGTNKNGSLGSSNTQSSSSGPSSLEEVTDATAAAAAANTTRRPSAAQVLGERFQQRRASQLGTASANLLAVQDKFKSTLGPLPSCPPSPSLDRHCSKCIALRQEARNDLLEDHIRSEAAQYVKSELGERRPSAGCGGLSSPLRWLRSLRAKHSYSFVEE